MTIITKLLEIVKTAKLKLFWHEGEGLGTILLFIIVLVAMILVFALLRNLPDDQIKEIFLAILREFQDTS